MKWAINNKTSEKRLKMATFKLLVLSYMHTTLYIYFFYSNNTKLISSMLCENTRKSLNLQIWVWHVSKYSFFADFSSMEVGL